MSNKPIVPKFQIVEDLETLDGGVTVETFFTREGDNNIRTYVYLAPSNMVVAYLDVINGVREPLQMDLMFLNLEKGEDGFNAILKHSGVYNQDAIELFNTGR